MKTEIQKYMVMIFAGLLMTACGNDGQRKEKRHAEYEEVHDAPTENEHTVSLSQKQAKDIGLELGKITQKNMGENVEVTGELSLFPQFKARVSPFVGGNVKAIRVIEGDKVKKGQTLAFLEHPDFIQMQQDLQAKYSQLDYLEQEYKRNEKLYNEQVGSGQNYQKAKAAYFSTAAEVNGLKTKLKLLGLDADQISTGKIYESVPVKAPINGFIHEIKVAIGDYVTPQKFMFEITENSRVHTDLWVYEKDVYKVKQGQKVYFTVANHPGKILEAKVHSIEKAFEKSPQAVHVHALIESAFEDDLLPGMYVEGRIVVNGQKRTVVPESAVVSEGGKSFIYMLTENEALETDDEHSSGSDEDLLTFKQVPVLKGVLDAGWVEIKFLEPIRHQSEAIIALTEAYTLLSSMGGEREHHH
ncbi:MAG TPA: efflux RND transporter periplasmic adaptor subunit [Sunxiuqinia sp.]|nr:efflux RND transporter periplasmic adaptor subunit [Sunxiuqinia sp.]